MEKIILLTADLPVSDTNLMDLLSSGSGFILGWLKDLVVQFLTWFMIGLLSILSPIINWGGKAAIVACYTIHYISEDSKPVATGFKIFFIMILFYMIEGVFIK